MRGAGLSQIPPRSARLRRRRKGRFRFKRLRAPDQTPQTPCRLSRSTELSHEIDLVEADFRNQLLVGQALRDQVTLPS